MNHGLFPEEVATVGEGRPRAGPPRLPLMILVNRLRPSALLRMEKIAGVGD